MKFYRYIAIQLAAYVIDISFFMIVLLVDIAGPLEANAFAKISAGCFAFFSHRHFTFSVAEVTCAKSQAIRYFLFLLLNVPFASGILALLLDWIPVTFVAKVTADVICVGLNYYLSKCLIFAKPHTDQKVIRSGL